MESIFRLFRANVRVPHEATGDLNAQVSACTIGERGLQDLAARYGADRLGRVMDGLLDHTERLLRQEIARWPDGTATFTDYMDSDGIDVLRCADHRHAHDRRRRDHRGLLRVARRWCAARLTARRRSSEASVYHTIMAACAVDIPRTAGATRPITVITKPGTVTHVVMPGAPPSAGLPATGSPT